MLQPRLALRCVQHCGSVHVWRQERLVASIYGRPKTFGDVTSVQVLHKLINQSIRLEVLGKCRGEKLVLAL